MVLKLLRPLRSLRFQIVAPVAGLFTKLFGEVCCRLQRFPLVPKFLGKLLHDDLREFGMGETVAHQIQDRTRDHTVVAQPRAVSGSAFVQIGR